jgi:hypothetical protein
MLSTTSGALNLGRQISKGSDARVFPTQFSEQERQICEREISKLINKPVLLRNKHGAREDELQRLAKFEPL